MSLMILSALYLRFESLNLASYLSFQFISLFGESFINRTGTGHFKSRDARRKRGDLSFYFFDSFLHSDLLSNHATRCNDPNCSGVTSTPCSG